ncbi:MULTISPECIES: Crp/Fnr family transcriptional regulator [Leptospira]|uniref:CRP/FNR family transcriptional regulator n=2 Tax=Leptospira TaxID=171 RepID=A0A4R8N191_LEPME|nr:MULTISPECIES: Crp/Fnr family transcriptional regulator [Leptospira]EMJ88881.1 cyclic nucleotide-binding domain protein [Leptospira meyeri serovar Semaranga str. Veldrot Semarang 173]MCG6139847.1 Crp/Fnr family transcriptional regulator [Leptospira mtsangambouensis]MCW7488564.1 Crp/Fnr family transcriptional regulator [Leptospira meyeri]PJZ81271.1 Crp/Fnr family transcriptional regulator [Leptospira meyeri]PJZ96777.1 Crp/Fnr family transcriptional regulator [Leptospira meyeri]
MSFFQMVTFPANSYIIVEGKKDANNFYIIREGKVRVTRETAVVGEDPNQVLGPGDFFGVVAAMSQHPQIESATSLTNVSLISVSYDQFGTLIQKSTAVAMNIIRFFSMKLRQFDTTITRLSFRNAVEEDPNELFKIGEYYFQQQNTSHATFAYQSYLKHLPNGQFVPQAKLRLQTSNQPFQAPPIDYNKFNRNYKDSEMIFCEHEPGKELFILQSGKVKISKIVNQNEVMLAVLQAGDIFGEMAILDNKPRSASAVAAGDVELLAINKANFEGMVKAQPQLATRLITLLSERIWIAYKQLANLLLKDPQGRIVDTLMTLAEKNRIKVAPKQAYNFEIGTKDLLKMVGLTDPKDELLISDIMKNNKFIRMDMGKIVCTDMAELEKLVQFYHKKANMENKLKKLK